MRRLLGLIILSIFLTSCGSRKTTGYKRSKSAPRSYSFEIDKRLYNIIDDALTYQGVRYKWGGTDRKGMDCSGLVYMAFKSENIALPRVSRNMATEGIPVDDRNLLPGDLLFFKTEGSRKINHVGLVIDRKPGEILFVHATVSLGVIISSLDERYWTNIYTGARRIL